MPAWTGRARIVALPILARSERVVLKLALPPWGKAPEADEAHSGMEKLL